MDTLASGTAESLVERMQAGDDDAFAQCVNAWSGRMLAVARRILRNEEDARDAVQEAFLSAFKQIGQFQGRARLDTWLHRIVVNAALCRLRTLKRRPEQSIDDFLPRFVADEHHANPPAPWQPASASMQQRELYELVHRCIGQLPEQYRIVLVLRDIEGLGTEETVQMLGASTGVVKTRLHRARQALRTLLDPYFREGDA